MDQKSSNSDFETVLEKKSSFYSEIIITDHIDKPPGDKKDQIPGYLSITKGRFFTKEESKDFSHEAFKFRFDKRELTFSSLKSAVESILKGASQVGGESHDEFQKYFKNFSEKSPETFLEKDVCEIALKFYTTFGKAENELQLTKRLNKAFHDQEELPEDLVLLKFLHAAVIDCPIYKGVCVRAIALDKEELDIYKPGSIINWRNFNSSSKGKDPVSPFNKKNTYFYLSSITGRDISEKSSFREEREVLFLPGCNFIVEKKEFDKENSRTLITMKQVDVVFTENIVVWVDDQFSDKERQSRSKIYGQTSKYQLWIVEMPNINEARNYIEENLKGYLSQCKSFQIIVKSKILHDITRDFFAYANQALNGTEKICYCYWLKEDGEESVDIIKKQGFSVVNNEKDLMKYLCATFKYKRGLFDSPNQLNNHDLNRGDSNYNLSDDIDFSKKSSYNEDFYQSYQSEQDYSTQIPSDKSTQSGNFNSFITSQQNQNLPNNHCNPESSSQRPDLLKFKLAGGV